MKNLFQIVTNRSFSVIVRREIPVAKMYVFFKIWLFWSFKIIQAKIKEDKSLYCEDADFVLE